MVKFLIQLNYDLNIFSRKEKTLSLSHINKKYQYLCRKILSEKHLTSFSVYG